MGTPLKNIPLPWIALIVWASSRKDKSRNTICYSVCMYLWHHFFEILANLLSNTQTKAETKTTSFPCASKLSHCNDEGCLASCWDSDPHCVHFGRAGWGEGGAEPGAEHWGAAGARWGHAAFQEPPSVDTASSIGYRKGK